jgi:hypothetical protein
MYYFYLTGTKMLPTAGTGPFIVISCILPVIIERITLNRFDALGGINYKRIRVWNRTAVRRIHAKIIHHFRFIGFVNKKISR